MLPRVTKLQHGFKKSLSYGMGFARRVYKYMGNTDDAALPRHSTDGRQRGGQGGNAGKGPHAAPGRLWITRPRCLPRLTALQASGTVFLFGVGEG